MGLYTNIDHIAINTANDENLARSANGLASIAAVISRNIHWNPTNTVNGKVPTASALIIPDNPKY